MNYRSPHLSDLIGQYSAINLMGDLMND